MKKILESIDADVCIWLYFTLKHIRVFMLCKAHAIDYEIRS